MIVSRVVSQWRVDKLTKLNSFLTHQTINSARHEKYEIESLNKLWTREAKENLRRVKDFLAKHEITMSKEFENILEIRLKLKCNLRCIVVLSFRFSALRGLTEWVLNNLLTSAAANWALSRVTEVCTWLPIRIFQFVANFTCDALAIVQAAQNAVKLSGKVVITYCGGDF